MLAGVPLTDGLTRPPRLTSGVAATPRRTPSSPNRPRQNATAPPKVLPRTLVGRRARRKTLRP
eukprot:11221620-Lingulodinium_polyedra.AAC.1